MKPIFIKISRIVFKGILFIGVAFTILLGPYYLVETTRVNYIARIHISEAIANYVLFTSCLSQTKDKKTFDDTCTYEESDKYRVDSSDANNVVIHFNFKATHPDTAITKHVKGSMKLSANNSSNPPTIKCKNISLKNKFLPPACRK